MKTYNIDASGAWGFYHPMSVPKGWRMLGTIECTSDNTKGALGRSPAGVYAQITGTNVKVLDQITVAAAIARLGLR